LASSDKPKKEAAHSFGWHRQVLLELVERLDLRAWCWWCRTGAACWA
jgi:hypothetical protein